MKKRQEQSAKRNGKKIPDFLYYLNFKNLEQEINRCGYEMKPSRILFYYLLMILGCAAICVPFKLQPGYIILIVISGFLCLPVVLASAYRQRYEEARYIEVSMYISQMLSSFDIKPKILNALQETREAIVDGPMALAIDEAVDYILYTQFSEGDIKEEALAIIEKKYSCKRIRTLHKFILNVETNGGEYERTSGLLQKDRELWENRVEEFIKDQKAKRVEATGSIVAVVFICWLTLAFTNMRQMNMSIDTMPAYQIATAGLILSELFIYIKINCSLNVDLLQKLTLRSEKEIRKDYHMVLDFDNAKESRRSLILSIVPCLILFYSITTKNMIGIVIGTIMLILALFDHKIGYSMTKKQLKHEIEFAYPQWLMEMALLLQGNNVRNSIRQTMDGVSPVLKEPLEKLVADLNMYPDSKIPYQEFLGPLRSKAIESSMSTLYAVSVGSNGTPERQIAEIISRTIKMTDKAEAMENQDTMESLKLFFNLPAIPGTIVIFVYMALICLAVLNGSAFY